MATMTIDEALKAGFEQHRRGALDQAEKMYRHILQVQPGHADALHLLGLICHQSGQHDSAERWIRQALDLKPDFAQAHYNLGNVYREQGKLSAAAASYRQALALQPGAAETHYNLANVLSDMGANDEAVTGYQAALRLKPDYEKAGRNLARLFHRLKRFGEAVECLRQLLARKPGSARALAALGNALREQDKLDDAAAAYRQALAADPNLADVHNNLGVVLQRLQRLDEAAAIFREALRMRPDYAEARSNLAMVLRDHGRRTDAVALLEEAVRNNPQLAEAQLNLGSLYREQKKFAEAAACFREAIRLQPELLVAYVNLGNVLIEEGAPEEALGVFEPVLRLEPGNADALSGRANALRMLDCLEEAVEACRHVTRLRPDQPDSFNNLAIALGDLGRMDGCHLALEHALRLQPDHGPSHMSRALALLQAGKFQEGWLEYEWRWKGADMDAPGFAQPRWDGTPLAGRTLLLHAEQGMGDNIQFIRLAASIDRGGGKVLFHGPKPLARLFATCAGIDQFVEQGAALPAFDLQCPLLSVAGLLGIDASNLPAAVPYLFAEPELRSSWRGRLQGHAGLGRAGLKVGICWRGNPRFRMDRRRSFPLAAFAPLAQVDGVRLYSLQKGAGAEQLNEWGEKLDIADFSAELGDFADTAAFMAELDLVIACDTSVAHLAGALGVPVWLAVPKAGDWRWLTNRDDSPWYPTMRLFRQEARGDWAGVAARVACALEEVGRGGTALTSLVGEPARARVDVVKASTAPAEPGHQAPVEPSAEDAKINRGASLARQGKWNEALAAFEEVCAANPACQAAHFNRGIALAQLGKFDAAADSYQQALALQPDHVGAWSNLGVIRTRQDRLDDALECFERALALQHDFGEALVNIATIHKRRNRLDKALELLDKAKALKPDLPEVHFNLATIFAKQQRFDEAREALRQALFHRPDYPEALIEMGNVCLDQDRPDEAAAVLDRAVHMRPTNPDLHKNLSLALLQQGDLERGWFEYEWRWCCDGLKRADFPKPLWDGTPLGGRPILLHAEQGLGDAVQFVRYARLVHERGGRVILRCRPEIASVLASCPGVHQVISTNEPLPSFDCHAPLLGLPAYFHTSLATIPAEAPYLSADERLREHWRRELESLPGAGLRLGIVWRGNPQHPDDERRSFSLAQLAPLSRVVGIQLVSLQKGEGEAAAELRQHGDILRITDVAARLRDFGDTAALITQLNLVIACDTAVAHLAGALGAPVWLALAANPDWRWLLGRADSPWYPTMRLFRQPRPGDWAPVFERMAQELHARPPTRE